MGGQFFGVQILLLIINSTNEIIITQITGPNAVVEYSMYFRLFSAIIALYSVIINPVWSSVSESYSKRDYLGIINRKKTIRLIAFTVVTLSFILAFMLPFVFRIFYGNEAATVDFRISMLFAVFTTIMIFVNSTSCIENGINDLRPQIIGNFIAAILKIPIIILISHLIDSWVVVIIGNTIIMTLSYLIQRIGLRRKLRVIKIEWTNTTECVDS